MNQVLRLLAACTVVALLGSAGSPAGAQRSSEKLTHQLLIERHVAAVGTPEARGAVKSRVATGDGSIKIVLGGAGEMSGTVTLASEGEKLGYSLPISQPNYPEERFAYDGKDVYVANVQPGRASRLGRFIKVHGELLSSGLMGGTLSTAWPLLAADFRGAKFEYRGEKKVQDRRVHELHFRPRTGSGQLKISLFFELETYRHVYSRYELEISAKQGTNPEDSAKQLEQRYRLEEEFGDFQTVDGVTLPRKWFFRLTTEGGTRTSIWTWDQVFTQIRHNIPVDPKSFRGE